MKRTKRVIQHDFPECSVPRAELQRIFAELRERRLAAERRKRGHGARKTAPKRARSPRAHELDA